MLKEIELNNKAVFDAFLNIEKPIIAAVNGPAIGASVTTATLCNAVSMCMRVYVFTFLTSCSCW